MFMKDFREIEIIEFVKQKIVCNSKEIHENIKFSASYATVKRILAKLVSEKLLIISGHAKNTKYAVSLTYDLLHSVDIEAYYKNETDERSIKTQFNFELITDVLAVNCIFYESEMAKLSMIQSKFLQNVSQLSVQEYRTEFERLAIDLSWKSSQIEGNTYSLLETERLLKEKETACGKTKEEAVMLLNHKEALDFILENPDYLSPLSVSKIEDIHSILTKELEINRNIRNRRVGITGTNYRPLDNEFQIKEALFEMCKLVNTKENVFEKALLALLLISYIQPFADGNKRTARIVSNAILLHNSYCPLSFRTVDSVDYKKALLLFYEQNNVSRFKEIFINQFEFAVNTYF